MRIFIALATQNSKGMYRAVHFADWLDIESEQVLNLLFQDARDTSKKELEGDSTLRKVFNGECTEAVGRITADELFYLGVYYYNHYDSGNVWKLFALMHLLARSKRQLYLICSVEQEFYGREECALALLVKACKEAEK